MRDSVEDLLLAELGERLRPRFLERLPLIGRRVARRRRERDDGPLLLSALQAVGVLSADEAVTWQGRLAEALTDRDVESQAWSPEASARAEDHLRELHEAGRSAPRVAALETYVSTGVLGADVAEQWEQDLEPDDLDADGHDATEEPPFRDDLGWLQAVVLGPKEPACGLRLVAAELYDGGVVIRWHRLRTAPLEDLCGDDGGDVALHDALGTQYAWLEGSRGQSAEAIAGSWWFEPAAPEGCERLELEALGARFEIDVQAG